MMSLTALHDQLLEIRPEGAEHNSAVCPFCREAETAVATGSSVEGGVSVSEKTHTEEEVKALVASAVAEQTKELERQLDELKQSEEASEVEARIATAKAEAEAQVAEIQAKLDAAVLEAEQAKTEHNEILTWLNEEGEKAAREAELETLTDERKAKVAEVATFPEDYMNERAPQWAEMSEEAFESLLGDYKAVGAEKSTKKETEVPDATAMKATREDNGHKTSAASDVIRMRVTDSADLRL
jgi:hypothetical protein